jgi:hypothetical protein
LSAASHIAPLPSATSVTIDLSSQDKVAVNGLLNNDGTQATDATVYNLSASAGWDSLAASIKTQAITTGNVSAPDITAVSYNAKTGVFSVTGTNFSNQGANEGIAMKDFTLTGGASGSYAFNSNDVVSNVTAKGFIVTLSSIDKSLVNSFVTANGTAPSSGAAYELSSLAHWDSGNGAAISNQSVTVSGVTTTVSHISAAVAPETTTELTLVGVQTVLEPHLLA